MVRFWNSCISEWEGRLTLHKGGGSRSFMTMTIWWPRSAVWIYQIAGYPVCFLDMIIKSWILFETVNENLIFHSLFFLVPVDHSKGFGGKYGIQTDRVDSSAKGWSEHSKPELHPSQTDHKKGFGGKFGVDSDRVDKSAKGWSEHSKTELHSSQTDHKRGFGGKFGVEDHQDEVEFIVAWSSANCTLDLSVILWQLCHNRKSTSLHVCHPYFS